MPDEPNQGLFFPGNRRWKRRVWLTHPSRQLPGLRLGLGESTSSSIGGWRSAGWAGARFWRARGWTTVSWASFIRTNRRLWWHDHGRDASDFKVGDVKAGPRRQVLRDPRARGLLRAVLEVPAPGLHRSLEAAERSRPTGSDLGHRQGPLQVPVPRLDLRPLRPDHSGSGPAPDGPLPADDRRGKIRSKRADQGDHATVAGPDAAVNA